MESADLAVGPGALIAKLFRMQTVLAVVLQYSPWRILGIFWFALLAIEVISHYVPRAEAAGVPVAVAMVLGGPHLVLLGLPVGLVGSKTRRVAACCAALFILVVIGAIVAALPNSGPAIAGPFGDTVAIRVISTGIAIAVNVAVFLPVFLATVVVDGARMRIGTYKPLDSIATFLCLYLAAFGGLVLIHRYLREICGQAPMTAYSQVRGG